MSPQSSSSMTTATKTTTRFPSARNSLQNVDTHVLEDVRDLGWKLYGKNEHFAITINAVVKIQAFVRGCMSRGKTSDMIQELIDGILSYREIVAKYAAEDEARVQKQQLTAPTTCEVQDDDDDDAPGETQEKLSEYPIAPKRAATQARPWKEREAGYVHPSTPLEFHLQEVLELKEVETSTERPWLKKKQAATPNTAATTDESDFESSSAEVESPVRIQDTPKNAIFDSPVPKSESIQGGLKDRLNFWESQSPQKSPPLHSSERASPKSPNQHSLPPIVRDKNPTTDATSEDDSVKSSSSLESVESYYNTPDGKKKATPISSRASTPIMHNSRFRSDEDEKYGKNDNFDPIVQYPAELANSDIVPEPGGRGYQRYKTNANFRNKRRPWRDDTDVFDAY